MRIQEDGSLCLVCRPVCALVFIVIGFACTLLQSLAFTCTTFFVLFFICFLRRCSSSNLVTYHSVTSKINFFHALLFWPAVYANCWVNYYIFQDILCAPSLVASEVFVMAFVCSSQTVVSHVFCLVTLVICHWHLLKLFHLRCENFGLYVVFVGRG